MKGQQIVLYGGIILLFILLSGFTESSSVDLSGLVAQFGADNVQRLQNVANVLSGQGLTSEQVKYCLAQILQETGLFTGNPNYHATDALNNYAGISNSDGSLKQYSSINDFVTDYIRVLNLSPYYPIEAITIGDFNARLKGNNYYADSETTYGNALNYYYDLL